MEDVMVHRDFLEAFLEEEEVAEKTIAEIMDRVDEWADEQDMFQPDLIVEIIGDAELAERFEWAWNNNSRSHVAMLEAIAD